MRKIDQLRTKVVNAAIADYGMRKNHGSQGETLLLDMTVEELLAYLESTKVMYGKAPEDKYLTQAIYGKDFGTRTSCIICDKIFWTQDTGSWTHDYDKDIYEARNHVRQHHSTDSQL